MDVTLATHRSKHLAQGRSFPVLPTTVPDADLIRVGMKIRDYGSTLYEGAHQDCSTEEIPLPNELSDAKGQIDPLRDDLAGRSLKVREFNAVRQRRDLGVAFQA